ncbi:hypothetical protein DL764_002102 [Monosporascus ibericus]|uniref:C3H1-type domain-containing protein n=1 Tax=Monosporascus ibericus TaxID=155417 RepID=A0A4V1XC10_9PEZI|nr:hypothetical protein DL764_002102 [Monosporascus ibericus]
MLSDQEIEHNAKQLADYKRNDALPDILERYANLIEDYKRLKSDYEEEREGRERYKQMARGQERNPFVLVLVDGDGYVFDDELVRDGTEGGSRAAKRLNDTVKHSLRRKGLEGCEIMVRVYANLVGLSKALYKVGLCGAEKRSLAPFTAGFNRSYGLNDFVDAGELKENADFKLRAMLRLYAENAQCKHIYFAACHDVGYVSELIPYRGNTDRFTLVSTPSLQFHDEFAKLGMNIEELPGVFRTAPLDLPYKAGVSWGPSKPLGAAPSPAAAAPPASDGQKICQFYQIGKCKYGKGCKNQHVDTRQFSFQTGRAAKPENDFSNNFGRAVDQPIASTRDNYNSDISHMSIEFTLLPRNDEIPKGYVAINQTEHRLDVYIPPPSSEVMARFKLRSEYRKLCNNKHLAGSCENERCEYDHGPVADDLKPALELLSRSMPCPKRGTCRNANCIYGHICQRADCKHRGGKVFCRFPYLTHFESLALDSVVPGVAKKPTPASNTNSNQRRSPSTDDEDGYHYPARDVESEGEEGAPIMGPVYEDGTAWFRYKG